MKVYELHSENIEKIKVIDITPKDDVIELSGKNGAGKSSVLNSIEYAITGKVSERPIRDGSDKATIQVDLGEYIVKRIFTEKSSRLEVLTKEGHVVKRPQEILNSLRSDLTFDPLEFAKMKKENRRDLLLKLSGINFDELDSKKNKYYEERTFIGREGASLKGQLEKFDDQSFSDIPDEEISMSQLNAEYSDVRGKIESVKNIKFQITALDEQIEHCKNEQIALDEKIKNALAQKNLKLKSLPKEDIVSLNKLQDFLHEQLSTADETNRQVREKKEWSQIKIAYESKQKEYQDLTDKIKKLNQDKLSMIQKTKMPIENLSFSDSDVLYNDIPFSQLSSGEELTVSLSIAMAMNPKLKVIRISDGSLLDSEHMGIIRNMAKDKDYQVWIERVDESGNVGIYFEEGEIKKIN